MSYFVKLTKKDGLKTVVNIDNILYIAPTKDHSDFSVIFFNESQYLIVQESLDELSDLLEVEE
ncbi:hypothetical protein [Vibrio sp. SCSIO 43136]|uniref:hypothetical protein n=1 Tax=Vibrio sp. SCSIO 43136 TaxID=2819101 RepID=UPI00207637CF|nr:hypothetical protein [Vibrio sp. SCSIO 43136]USD63942.1 hypothetical protein J4N39_07320 [Vibrio sp. SCSIO 43136]